MERHSLLRDLAVYIWYAGDEDCLARLCAPDGLKGLFRVKNFFLAHVCLIPILFFTGYFVFTKVHSILQHNYHIIQCPWDDYIPFVSIFVIPYIWWFALIAISMILYFMCDMKFFARMCLVQFSGMAICILFYILWPNGIDLRPADTGGGFFGLLVDAIYFADDPYNVFPSIHCYSAVALFSTAIRGNLYRQKPMAYVGYFASCVLICMSTMFIKQHSVADVIAGVALGTVMSLILLRPSVVERLSGVPNWPGQYGGMKKAWHAVVAQAWEKKKKYGRA